VLDGLKDLEAIRHVEGLKSKREWGIVTANSFNWSLKM
jgi:hypothetical protein